MNALAADGGTARLERNHHVASALCFPGIFDAGECEAVIALGRGRTRYLNAQSAPIEGYRLAGTYVINAPPDWLERKMAYILEHVNRRYRFDVAGFREDFMLCQYVEGDGFEWHLDTGTSETSTRKISLSVQLSDPAAYDEGALEFMPGGRIPFARERGSVISFPSFLCHRVSRVTRGERWALVAWAHGSSFR